jgi:hypothetical protein
VCAFTPLARRFDLRGDGLELVNILALKFRSLGLLLFFPSAQPLTTAATTKPGARLRVVPWVVMLLRCTGGRAARWSIQTCAHRQPEVNDVAGHRAVRWSGVQSVEPAKDALQGQREPRAGFAADSGCSQSDKGTR